MSRPTGAANLIAMGLLETRELTHRPRRRERSHRRRLRELLRRG